MALGDDDLINPFSRAANYMREASGVLALVGTIIPFLFFTFNIFNLGEVGRVVSTFVLFSLIIGTGVILLIKDLTNERDYLREKLQKKRSSDSDLALTSLAFEILNGDNEKSIDENHFYSKQKRIYDISGDQAYFYNRYEGSVKPGKTSRGIVFKYIGDGRVDGRDLNISVTRHKPKAINNKDITPEIITNDENPYAVTLLLPFGKELSGGDQFDIEVECPEMGATPSNQRVSRVHFPLHRYERVDTFDAEIVTPRNFVECEAAIVNLHRDEITMQRDVLVGDFELDKLDMDSKKVDDTIRYSFVKERSAAKLYVFRFLSGE